MSEGWPPAWAGRVLVPLACAAVAGCSSWYPRPVEVLRAPLAPREQAQLWVGTRAHLVHGVLVRGDSVWAVPYFLPIDCDSCVQRFALAEIDSVRLHCGGSEIYREGCQSRGPGRSLMLVTVLGLVTLTYVAITRWNGGGAY